MKLQKTDGIANRPQVFSLSSKNPLKFVGTTTELNRDEYCVSKIGRTSTVFCSFLY